MAMNIAIIGAGGIGSTFAVQLVRAGHDVTLVARGARLAGLESAGGVATEGGALDASALDAHGHEEHAPASGEHAPAAH